MTHKQKNKLNPFAAFLQPTETMIWQSPERINALETLFPIPKVNPVVAVLVGIVILLILVIPFLTVKNTSLLSGLGVGVTALLLIGARLFARRIFNDVMGGRPLVGTLPDNASYGITSERLFYQRGDDIRAVSLDKVTSMKVVSAKGTRAALSFGGVFPQWGGLEDAEHIKSIIEQAQKERSKA